jgi:hypothetical protein
MDDIISMTISLVANAFHKYYLSHKNIIFDTIKIWSIKEN